MSEVLNIIDVNNYEMQKMKSEGGSASGTITITADGQYNVKDYATANVNVPKIKCFQGFSFGYSTNVSFPNNLTIDISDMTDLETMFTNCANLETAPMLNTSHITSMRGMFNGSKKLKNIPLYDTSGITDNKGFYRTFLNTLAYTDTTSAYNILQMCINAVNYPGTKTLNELGIRSTELETFQNSSNWDDFVAAGWSTGY